MLGVPMAWIAPAPATAADRDPALDRVAGHLRESPRLLGDPGGGRSRLELLGIEPTLFYNQVFSANPQGGAESDQSVGSSGSYDFFALADAEALVGWPGLRALFHAKGQYDENVNEDVGALSDPIDDADFDEGIYVSELWLQQDLARRRLRLRAGFMEAQTLYDRNAYANSEDRQFLASFLDNNGILPLPNGLGAFAVVSPTPVFELAIGVMDADNEPKSAGFETFFDGVSSWSAYLELALHWNAPWRDPEADAADLPGALRLGGFRDGRDLESFVRPRSLEPGERPDSDRGHYGFWMSFDQQLWGASATEAGPRAIGVFARAGYADPDVNRIAGFWSLGFEVAGPVPFRPLDVLGVGGYHAIPSDRYHDRIDDDFDGEGGIEVYYRIAVVPWLSVTPAFQYVVDPGGRSNAEDAVVTNLRLRVVF